MWKKRILAFLLCVCMLIPSELATIFAEGETTEYIESGGSETTIPECVCENTNEDLTSHSDTECVLKAYCVKTVAEKTASEIYDDWDKYPENARSFILTYMSWNSQYGDKLAELNTLINGGGSTQDPELPESIANDGTKVTLSGENLPENATVGIKVNDAVKPLLNKVEYVYDISLSSNGVECQPSGEVIIELGIDVWDKGYVYVYHFLDDVENILKLSGEEKGLIIENAELAAKLPEAAQAANEGLGISDAVYVEVLSTLDGNVSMQEESIQFKVNSFSTFAVMLYTVDFYYEDVVYSIPGGSNILLSELFSYLGITKDAKTAMNVYFSDETLVASTKQADGDWVLTSLEAFQTTETLTIDFGNNEILELEVTDETRYTVYSADGITADYIVFDIHGSAYVGWNVYYTSNPQGASPSVSATKKTSSVIESNDFGFGTQFHFNSNSHWFYATIESGGNIWGTSRLDEGTDGLHSLKPYNVPIVKKNRMIIAVYAIPNTTYSNASYCTVAQRNSVLSTGYTTRTVKVYVDSYSNSPVGTWTGLFPTRTDASDTLDGLSVSSVNSKYSYIGEKKLDGNDLCVLLRTNHTVTYDKNTTDAVNNMPSTQSTYYGQSGFTLSANHPTRTGYTFKNWNTVVNGSGTSYAKGASYNVIGSLKLYAQWTPNTNTAYKIEYYKDGIVDATVSATGTTGAIITYDTDKYGDTYKFSSVSPANPTIAADGSTVVKVYYVKNTAEVTGTIDNGGQVSNPSQEIVIGQKSKEMIFTPASGYKITSVTINNVAQTGFSETQYIYSAQTVNNAINVVVTTAPIEYTITYDSNGGSSVVSQDYTITTSITLATAPTRNGYTFTGWKLASMVNNWTATTYSASHNVGSGKYGNITLVAQWSKDTYTISYNIDGGTAVQAQSYTITDENVTLSAATTKAGYEFKGWVLETTVGNWTAKTYAASENVGTGKYGNVTLKALWSPIDYTITYDSNGGSDVTAKSYDITTNLTLSPAPIKAGYTFNGWKPESSSGSWTASSYTAGQNVGVGQYGDVTLVAQWTQTENTAEAVAGAGISGTSGGGKYHYNDSVTFTATVAPGYQFDGWYNGSEKESSDASHTFTMPDDDVSYTAKATPITYTITYEGLEGAEVSGNPTTYTVESNDITLNNPTKTGYTFTGWSGTGYTGENNKNVTIPKGSTENRTYTAHWQINSYTITGVIDRGTVNNVEVSETNPYTQSVDYNASGVKMTFTPAAGYEISSITINGVAQAVSDKESFGYTPTNVVEYIRIEVTTVPKEYTITWKLEYPDGTVKIHATQTKVPFGSVISTPEVSVDNYVFSNDWKVTSPTSGAVPATMPNNDLVIRGTLSFNGGSLTISKSGMEAGKSTVYTISGGNLAEPVYVTIEGNGSVTINYLPVGTYTVKEEAWSWEYTCESETPSDEKVDGIITVNISKGNAAVVTFSNQKKTSLVKWLSGESRKNNKFGSK